MVTWAGLGLATSIMVFVLWTGRPPVAFFILRSDHLNHFWENLKSALV
jgi:hypothetical protein